MEPVRIILAYYLLSMETAVIVDLLVLENTKIYFLPQAMGKGKRGFFS